ncbi:MAG: response regulator [Alphaproteobacteria bacterium]|nr:response regulator [Alphaproteobacteria bacterium]
MEHVSFSLSDVLDDVANLVRSARGGPKAGKFLAVAGEIPSSLTGDPATLVRALVELLENVFECAGSGKIAAIADVFEDSTDRDQRSVILRLTVRRNDEAGLTCEEAANLLMKFSSTSPATGDSAGADGSAGARELADRLGASIAVASEPGEGFAVSFTAEFGMGPGATGGFQRRAGYAMRHNPNAEIRMPAGLERIQGARILLAEDHPVNQNLTREILVHAGCSVAVAEDGQETVDAVRDPAQSYDAIIMDVQMPIMDGFEATRIIRADLSETDLPIIAMTANVLGDERERCLAVGMNDYVSKPIHIPDLYAALIRCIKPGEGDAGKAGESAAAARHKVPNPRDADVFLPDQIPQIDVESGLARAMGNRELYVSLLAQFAKSNEILGTDVGGAIAAGDLDKARFLVHGLASTAGNIGADALYSCASELEKAIVARSDDIDRLFQGFQVSLDGALAAIRESGISPQSKLDALGPREAPFDRQEASRLAKTFMKTLDDQDMGAHSHLDKLLDILAGQGQDEQLKRLEASLETLDFPKAREILDGICKDILT